MKAPVKLSLAIALALASGSAFALGLGTIQVKSGLNQPLDAEIPVITDSAAEANALTVDMASAADFERIGLSKARVGVAIDMTVGTNAKGQTVIKLTTKEPVREPLLDFLLVANWSKGKLLREYTVLLDPPVTAPAKSAATVAPLAEKPVAKAQPLTEPKPAPPPKPAPQAESKPPAVAAAPKPAPKAAPAPPPPAPKPAAAPAPTGNDYGPVAQGETLSEIARATRPNEKASVDQMMLALLKANPKAFYQDNINALKRGAILRIPSGDDLKATGSLREAAEQVHNQNAAWTGKAPVASPTLVAKTGTTSKSSAAPAKPAAETKPAKQERLALVPPGSAKSDSSTDRAGASGGTGKDNSAEVKAELARTKEALASREQEASELKSRVKQLEDIGTKDQRLLSMKDSEIAELQKKLKDLEAKSAAPATAAAASKPAETPAAKPAETSAAKPDQKITAKDIWGDMNAGDKGAKPAAGATPSSAATSGATTPAPSAPATGTTPAPAAAPSPAPEAASTPPTTASATPPAPAAEKAADTGSSATAASTPAATPAAEAKPATSTSAPAKSTPAAKVTPLEPAAEPFYKNQNVLLGGGAALLLVGLLALMRFMRKPKPAFAGAGEDEAAAAGADDDELRLRDALQQNPANTAASLELLRHYYSRGDAAKFEAAAESMHGHIADPHAPEWEEVLAMGSVLAPNHPLFSAAAMEPMHEVPAHAEPLPEETHAEFDYPEHEHAPVDDARTHVGTFDYEPAPADTHHAEPVAAAAPAHDDSFDFDLPLRTEEEVPAVAPVAQHEPEQAFAHEAAQTAVAERQDDIYVGEDAIGTKLDLAKAYLDMGDPEGAKSMLDEVMAEGNDSQRDEARKLLAEIR